MAFFGDFERFQVYIFWASHYPMTSTSGSSGSLAQGGFDKNIASWRGHDIGALWPLSGHSGCGERLGRFLFGPSAAESLHDP